MAPPSSTVAFVLLQVFSCEGGIQSYVKDVLAAYAANAALPPAQILLLRDGPDCENFLATSDRLSFQYLKATDPRWGRARLALSLMWQLLRRRHSHVICGHVLLIPLVAPLCRFFRVPYTVMTYGKEVWTPLAPRYRRGLQGADRLWSISRYSRDVACQTNGLDPDRVALLPCVVDGDRFTPGPKSPQLVAQYGLKDARVLMTVARLWSGDIYKGVDVTIRALPKICQDFPDVKYLVIGRGDDQPRLAQLAQDLGVADRVVFAGFVPTEALVDHYRLADAYVMPSQEGFGIVYMEAMACGIPVLSGDADGSADPLQDGRLGWRVPHRDVAAVAAAVAEMLEGGDRRCQGTWLRQETLAQFSSEQLQRRLASLVQPS